MAPLLWIGAAALAALLLGRGKSAPQLPPGLADRIATAIATRDARLLRALATEAPESARPGILNEARRIELAAVARVSASKAGLVPAAVRRRPTRPAGPARNVSPTAAPAGSPPDAPPGDVPPVAARPPSGPLEDPKRQAALDLTSYLRTIGGLKGRGTESRSTVSRYQTLLGLPADGSYGRLSAATVMQLGVLPVAPYYWPKDSVKLAKAKKDFQTLIARQLATDPERADEWRALSADVGRA
jgi:hypothetical protein